LTNSKHIKAYVLDWHISNSLAFVDFLLDPLRSYYSIEFEEWDGTSLPSRFSEDSAANGTCVFCQLPPPPSAFEVPGVKIIWAPMWDQAQGYSQKWWQVLPKSVRVLAFSEAVATRAERAGLELLRLKYFKDPSLLRPARWNQGLCLMYWNRTGILGPDFLERLCAELQIRKLLFQSVCDPLVSAEFSYRLPSRLGSTIVEEIPEFLPREQYLQLISQANLYCAPRSSEGVGIAFLEAMARGCGVLAYDGPTMNEYVVHLQNGYLLEKSPDKPTILERVIRRMRWTTPGRVRRKVSMRQDWACLRAINWQALGDAARNDHMEGHRNWLRSIPILAAFIDGRITGPRT